MAYKEISLNSVMPQSENLKDWNRHQLCGSMTVLLNSLPEGLEVSLDAASITSIVIFPNMGGLKSSKMHSAPIDARTPQIGLTAETMTGPG